MDVLIFKEILNEPAQRLGRHRCDGQLRGWLLLHDALLSGLKSDSREVRRKIPRALRNQLRSGAVSVEELVENVGGSVLQLKACLTPISSS